MNTAVLVLDAIGDGFFATSGAAIAGGMLRDVVAAEVPCSRCVNGEPGFVVNGRGRCR